MAEFPARDVIDPLAPYLEGTVGIVEIYGSVGGFLAGGPPVLAEFFIRLLVPAIVDASVNMGLIIHGLFPVGDAYLLDSPPDENRGRPCRV